MLLRRFSITRRLLPMKARPDQGLCRREKESRVAYTLASPPIRAIPQIGCNHCVPCGRCRAISLVEKEVIEAAEAMPEDKFDCSPEKLNLPGSDYKGVRTFGEQLKHIAASNYLIWSPITGEKPPDTVNDGKGPDNMKAKAE